MAARAPPLRISLTIAPPFSSTEVELCHIGRVASSTQCELVFVFKNFKKQFYKVKDVSMASLADLKDQLSCLAIKYTEGFPHNWPEIRKTISRDPEKFYDSGGWSFLESQNPDDLHSRGVDVGGDGDGVGDGGGGGGGGVGPPSRKKIKTETVVPDDKTLVIISSGKVWL